MLDQIYKSFSMLMAVFVISLALTTNSYALFLTSGTSSYSWKTLANGNDFVCQTDDGEMSIDASINPDETVSFIMESPIDTDSESPTYGQRISHTCCEVPHDSGLSVAECEAGEDEDGNPVSCNCGEFTLDQKVEDYTADVDGDVDPVLSNCLEAETDVTGNLESYRCHVSNGAPKETWVWHLIPVDTNPDTNPFCDSACTAGCGVAMGTTANAKPGEYDTYGNVWHYNQYRDPNNPDDSTNILLADFHGSWCHTGSFCLDDDIQCEVKSAKVELRTSSTAEYIVVEVDTVNTFNGNSTSGNTPTDFLSTTSDGVLLVDPTEIDTASITINGSPVTVLSSTSDSDRNADGFPDLRTHISTADYQHALYPDDGCVPDEAKTVLFKGTFTDGRIWIGPTTVNVVCN